MKECVDIPILRETIKQYILLIKKLTNMMDKKEEIELLTAVLKNYDAANQISRTIKEELPKFTESFRGDLCKKINEQMGEKYYVEKELPYTNKDCKILISMKGSEKNKVCFGLSNFSTIDKTGETENIWMGIFSRERLSIVISPLYIPIGKTKNDSWITTYDIPDFQNTNLNLRDGNTLYKLYTDTQLYESIINYISNECKKYIEFYHDNIVSLLTDKANKV